LKDDAAAIAYACEIVREQCKSLTGLNSQVMVKDETRPRVFSISMQSSGENKPG
jgi:hypothetical protein